MSGVRVLVGTRKGAFVLTSDGKREKWDVSGPHFAGWEIYHLKGSPADPNRLYASQSSGWFGQLIQRSDDGGKTWEPVGQQVRLRRRARHPPVVRRHAAPVGVQARLAPRAVADRSGHGLRRRRGRRAVPHDRRRPDAGRSCPGCAATAPGRTGSRAPAACACTRSSSTRATRTGSSSPSPPRARSAPTTAARPGSRSTTGCSPQYIPDPDAEVGHCVHRIAHAPVAAGRAVHAEALGRDAQRRRRRHRGTRSAATCRPTSASRSTSTPTSRRPSTSSRSRATRSTIPPDGKLRVYRSRTGGNEWEPLTKGLPQSDCYVNVLRDAMAVDSLDSCGIYFGTTGGQVYALGRRAATPGRRSSATCRPCCRSRSRRCHDPRRAARRTCGRWRASSGEVELEVERPGRRSARCSTRSRPRYPDAARARSATTSRSERRPFVRFFACEQDLSHEPPDTPLPEPVVRGAEPFLIVGAMAGG